MVITALNFERNERRTRSGAKHGARVNGSNGHHLQLNEIVVHELSEKKETIEGEKKIVSDARIRR